MPQPDVAALQPIDLLALTPRPTGHGSLVAGSPEAGPGHWAGAPSAVLVDGTYYLAYRLRRPVGAGRGFAVAIARSDDGERFAPLLLLHADDFGAESLERPALVRTADGRWRLYVSCATPGTKHWRIELLEAVDPTAFRAADARVVVPGDEHFGVKDPVVMWHDGMWHMWACFHPLDDAGEEDRMETRHATSVDGVSWSWDAESLAGRAGRWDSRGARISDVRFLGDRVIAYYDGRASKEENYEERTGIAVSADGLQFEAVGETPIAESPYGGAGLRYVVTVPLPDATRLYYEVTGRAGTHGLVTELVGSAAISSPPADQPLVPRQTPATA